MAFNISNLNQAYALGRDQKTGKWMVGQIINDALWTVDGTNKKIVSLKKMTDWRYFRTAFEHGVVVPFTPGDKLSIAETRTRSATYYVIAEVSHTEEDYTYIVGI